MADNKNDRGAPDRSRVASEQQYEIGYFAEKHGISVGQAREILDLAGPSREKADAA